MIKIHYEHIFATLAKLLASIDEFDPKQQQLGSVNGNFKFLGSHASMLTIRWYLILIWKRSKIFLRFLHLECNAWHVFKIQSVIKFYGVLKIKKHQTLIFFPEIWIKSKNVFQSYTGKLQIDWQIFQENM